MHAMKAVIFEALLAPLEGTSFLVFISSVFLSLYLFRTRAVDVVLWMDFLKFTLFLVTKSKVDPT